MSKSGIVNVRMVITEEKILSNIDKIQKLINPKSKKQIVQLEEDTMFKDLVQSIKDYLIEYPNKKNFPNSVYKAAYELVEYATNQFEENTKTIEELIIQRENNIALAAKLKKALNLVINKEENWKNEIQKLSEVFSEEIIDTLGSIGRARSKKSQNYQDGIKLINAKVANLDSNLHIEIDMERIEDRSKALSYIGIEIADALKSIPTPVEEIEEQVVTQNIEETVTETPINEAQQQYAQEMTFEAKPSLWERIKNSKIVRAVKAITKIRVVLDYSDALPEGRGENRN